MIEKVKEHTHENCFLMGQTEKSVSCKTTLQAQVKQRILQKGHWPGIHHSCTQVLRLNVSACSAHML
jgi:hypothetical protein